MPKSDHIRVQHMLDAAQEIRQFVRGKQRSDLETDRKLTLALVSLISIIGEAANQISEATQSLNPELPWEDMIGMRNRLIHGYDEIDLDIVWEVAITDLPRLIQVLEQLKFAG